MDQQLEGAALVVASAINIQSTKSKQLDLPEYRAIHYLTVVYNSYAELKTTSQVAASGDKSTPVNSQRCLFGLVRDIEMYYI